MFHVRKITGSWECTVAEFVVEEEEEEIIIPDEKDDTWMLVSTRTAPYYWLLHTITMVSIVCTLI